MKTLNYTFFISFFTLLVSIVNIGRKVEGFTAVRILRPTKFFTFDFSISLSSHIVRIQEEEEEEDHIMESKTSFRVKSCWSKAGIGTCFILEEEQHKNFEVVFDLGW